jgi:hypothetical protein
MRLADHKVPRRISIRPLSAVSLIPSRSCVAPDASLVIGEDLSFMATRVREREDYYELAWAAPEEVALLASLTIGAHPHYGKVHLFPAWWPVYVVDEGQDLSDQAVLSQAESILRSKLGESRPPGNTYGWQEFPPLLISQSYNVNENVRISPSYQLHLFQSIDCEDLLMIRGLVHLQKTAMLKCLSRSFMDTACLEIYVALEASLEIILRTLRASGARNPSNKDASDYLLEAHGATYRLEKYYEDFYEDRIKAVHPNSRFGPAMFSPLYVDDLYMLYNDLLRTFEFLITGKPNCHEEFAGSEL